MVSVMLILFNFPIESICWTSYDMNVLVSIKSGKQLSMSANFGMFVSLAIEKIIVNEYQLRYVCFLWKWQQTMFVCCELLISFIPTFLVSSLEQIKMNAWPKSHKTI